MVYILLSLASCYCEFHTNFRNNPHYAFRDKRNFEKFQQYRNHLEKFQRFQFHFEKYQRFEKHLKYFIDFKIFRRRNILQIAWNRPWMIQQDSIAAIVANAVQLPQRPLTTRKNE